MQTLLTALAVVAGLLALIGPILVLRLASTFSNLVFSVSADGNSDEVEFALLVRNGAIAPDSPQALVRMGGPGVLDVDENSAVVLEKFGRFSRALGPGYYFLERFERVVGSVDLRPQLRKTGARVYARDGIPIQYDVEIEFRLLGETVEDVQQAPRPKNRLWARIEPRLMRRAYVHLSSYHFSPRAAWSAVFPLAVNDSGQVTSWSDSIMHTGMDEIEKVLSAHSFDELSLPVKNGVLDSRVDMSVRRRVQREAEAMAAAALQRNGAQLIGLRFSSFRFDDEEARGILDQYFKDWQAHWTNAARLAREEGKTEAFKLQEDARAEAQLKMLALMSDGLSQISTRKASYDTVIMLRMFEALEHLALDKNAYRALADEMLSVMQKFNKTESGAVVAVETAPTLPAPAQAGS